MARDLDAFVQATAPGASMAIRASAFVEELFPGEAARRLAHIASKEIG
jgi:hypothetical protein